MRIAAALNLTLLDYPGKIAAEVFTRGCNFQCPHCHAKPLLDVAKEIREEDFLNYCVNSQTWINGVSICGGEPTLQSGLPDFIRKVRQIGLSVKLDTNGSNPDILEKLLAEKLLDYVAMDVKGPIELWDNIIAVPGYTGKIKESIKLVAKAPNHEFRTTIAPVIRGKDNISFLTVDEIGKTAAFIAETTASSSHKYFIQKFIPRKNGLINPVLETFPETPQTLLEQMKIEAQKYITDVQTRG